VFFCFRVYAFILTTNLPDAYTTGHAADRRVVCISSAKRKRFLLPRSLHPSSDFCLFRQQGQQSLASPAEKYSICPLYWYLCSNAEKYIFQNRSGAGTEEHGVPKGEQVFSLHVHSNPSGLQSLPDIRNWDGLKHRAPQNIPALRFTRPWVCPGPTCSCYGFLRPFPWDRGFCQCYT